MKPPVRKGGVYFVTDNTLTLPPNDGRNYHAQRSVIVVSGDAKNEDPDWPIVLVIPTSTQSRRKTQYCVKLGAGVGNLPSKCWARVVTVQPIVKDDLGDYLGSLPPDYVDQLEENLFAYMGLVD